MESFSRRYLGVLITVVTLFIGIGLVSIALPNFTSRDVTGSRPTVLAPKNLKYFALGYDEVMADSLWIRTIQDFDYCEDRPTGVTNPSQFRCNHGWVFHMIDAETELAPLFRQPYLSGAIMLTIIVNDIAGASEIFDKATKRFPKDWEIEYRAAYQALIEEHNDKKAADLLVQAGKNGAPPWVFALAAHLQARSGQLRLAKSILEDAIELAPKGPGAERIQKRLDEVNAELAKQPH